MNFVFIMTDTQNKSLVGAYGNAKVDTPNLDRLAADGIRFDKAYTACPLCTPARGAIFSGLHPQINGAYCNNIAPHAHTALLGTIFDQMGY
jgi:arylsulfatase A-like enzyme